MGEKSKRNKSTDELGTKIARSRERVDCDLRGLRYELDFPGKLQRSYRETNGFLVGGLNGGRRVDGLTVNAKEKNICRSQERPKSKQEACRNGLCSRCAENRSQPGPPSDCGAG